MTGRAHVLAVAAVAATVLACTSGVPGASPGPGATSPAPAAASPIASRPGAPTPPVTESTAASPAPPSVALVPSASVASVAAGSGPAPTSAPSQPSTSAIDWGVIWDALPPTFPQYPGAHPAVTGGGHASAILDIPADGPAASAWYQAALRTSGYTIVSANGPREDGTYDIVATRGSADCQAEISLAPLGTTTTATIFFGVACPFP